MQDQTVTPVVIEASGLETQAMQFNMWKKRLLRDWVTHRNMM